VSAASECTSLEGVGQGKAMKYGPIATSIPEWLALAGGKVPVPLLDSLFSILKARALMAGVRLGVFQAMQEGPRSAQQLAKQLALDEGSLTLLLRALAHSDYVATRGEKYMLSDLAKETMVVGGNQEMFGYVEWNYVQWEFLGHLEELIRTGKGVNFHSKLKDSKSWDNYQRGMLELARLQAPIVASRVPVASGAKRLLDLGGSHGLFGAAICRKHPPMKARVLDLAKAIRAARKLAKSEGIADIVEHREGDVLRSALGRGYDVVLLGNILHHFRPEQHLKILKRAFRALRPGATIAIWEIEAPRRGSKVSHADGAALYFRLTSTAGAYHGDHYVKLLRQAGYEGLQVKRLRMSPGNVLIIGLKPGN
jgi:2-polyprenyl-3-methyl-5-hydroxy-6-metoxy-1,4-benzoquinol methylase